MNQCSCGRPLWDGARSCEACMDAQNMENKRYKDRTKLANGAVSGVERCGVRRRLSNLGRGYDQ